jgi:hypothetical protein
MKEEQGMIYESYVWKRELRKELNNFRKLAAKMDLSGEQGIPDTLNLKVEKFFFVSAFIIRKLNEAKKLSDELNEVAISVVQYERINRQLEISIRNNHLVDKFYDLENGNDTSLSVSVLCNTLIHSFVFKVVVGDGEANGRETVMGILVNSDYSKDKAVYYLELGAFNKFVEEIINDDVITSSYNYVTGKLINSRKSLPDILERIFDNL